MDIGQSIRQARKAKGLTLEALANQVDTDTGNLSRLERGKQGASQELLGKIMKVLDMEVVSHIRPLGPIDSYALNNSIELTPEEHRTLYKGNIGNKLILPARRYPLFGWEEALVRHNSDHSEFIEEGTLLYPSVENASTEGFWLTVVGDSMASSGCPTFPEGMLILIHPASEAEPGKFYLVKMPNGQLTFKQYIEDAGAPYLRPLNPAYRVIPLDGEFEIVGRVIDTKIIGL
ncbi:LexA family transcriptional regulator [Pseudomonas sp. P66]|uniref:LexA family transcriptional regulator n=1 Tax=Pseudomonas arcuscaelestis TaxID=2710591 RepID=A0ABS2C315_9PSED|nr:XRE family transcriptional regulator [Pseudomonas arcuscaelestis]MBM5460262.1 LexA family transcriptional regulator [Pseudomonas arcuscaelestis]